MCLQGNNVILKASNGRPAEKRFLVGAQWWRKWCDYVSFGQLEAEETNEPLDEVAKHSRQQSLDLQGSSSNDLLNEYYAGSAKMGIGLKSQMKSEQPNHAVQVLDSSDMGGL